MPLIDLNGLGYFKGKENAMVAGNYSASNTYAVGDYVYYSGTLYRCTTAITTAEAWTAAHWTAAKLADDLTSQSEKIAELDDRTLPINQLDGVWEIGGIAGATGKNGTSTNQIRTKNYIPVKPNTSYFFKLGSVEGGGTIFQYSIADDSGYLGVSELISNKSGEVITTNATTHFIRISSGSAYGTTYNNDISLNYPSTLTGYYAPKLTYLQYQIDAVENGVKDASLINNNAIGRSKLNDSFLNTVKKILSSSDNLNTYTTPDVLFCSNDVQNAPNNIDSWVVHVIYAPWQNGSRYTSVQIAYSVSSYEYCKMFTRVYQSASQEWTAWRYITRQSSLANKKIVFMGDSTYAITGSDGYKIPSWIRNILGCTTYQCAFGGTRMSDSREATDTYKYFDFPALVDAIVAGDFSDQEANLTGKDAYYATNLATLSGVDFDEVDILCIEYGTNDFTADVAIGSTESNRATVGGALVYCLDKLLTKYPDLKIFVDGIRYRAWLSSGEFVDDIQTHENALNKTIFDYADAIQASANLFNVKYADNLHNYGWNKYNRSIYFPSNDNTHFNGNGTAYASKIIVDHLIEMGRKLKVIL